MKQEEKTLSSDLHEALKQVPINIDYHTKLALYSRILIEQYNWAKSVKYTTYKELENLPLGTRISTIKNELAVKHLTGWVIITKDGYPITHSDHTILDLPAFLIPNVT